MAITGGSLASGTVPTTLQDIYNPGDIAFVKCCMLACLPGAATTETVDLYFRRGLTGFVSYLGGTILIQRQRDIFFGKGDGISLSAGDSIQAITTTGGTVHFTLCGGTGTAG